MKIFLRFFFKGSPSGNYSFHDEILNYHGGYLPKTLPRKQLQKSRLRNIERYGDNADKIIKYRTCLFMKCRDRNFQNENWLRSDADAGSKFPFPPSTVSNPSSTIAPSCKSQILFNHFHSSEYQLLENGKRMNGTAKEKKKKWCKQAAALVAMLLIFRIH